jgi:hypothetical protein
VVSYQWTADPTTPGSTGTRHFCTDGSITQTLGLDGPGADVGRRAPTRSTVCLVGISANKDFSAGQAINSVQNAFSNRLDLPSCLSREIQPRDQIAVGWFFVQDVKLRIDCDKKQRIIPCLVCRV